MDQKMRHLRVIPQECKLKISKGSCRKHTFLLFKGKRKMERVDKWSDETFIYADWQRLLFFGLNNGGQGGLGHDEIVKVPEEVEFFNDIPLKEIVCGSQHSIFLEVTGQVWTCGRGVYGQLGTGNREDQLVPTRVQLPQGVKVVGVFAGRDFSVLLRYGRGKSKKRRRKRKCSSKGDVYTFGSDIRGQQGQGSTAEARCSPVKLDLGGKKRVVDVGCGDSHTMVLTNEREVWGMGGDYCGQLGRGKQRDTSRPRKALIPAGVRVARVECGWSSTFLLSGEEEVDLRKKERKHRARAVVFLWGQWLFPTGSWRPGTASCSHTHRVLPRQSGGGCAMRIIPLFCPNKWVGESLCGVREEHVGEGESFFWGSGCFGQCGMGNMNGVQVPTKLDVLHKCSAVSLGDDFSVALTAKRRLCVFGHGGQDYLGDSDSYQLGLGDLNDRSKPTPLLLSSSFFPDWLPTLMFLAGEAVVHHQLKTSHLNSTFRVYLQTMFGYPLKEDEGIFEEESEEEEEESEDLEED